nr:MAG TPA: hypothetical protein [Caudoviricetes sp.]
MKKALSKQIKAAGIKGFTWEAWKIWHDYDVIDGKFTDLRISLILRHFFFTPKKLDATR